MRTTILVFLALLGIVGVTTAQEEVEFYPTPQTIIVLLPYAHQRVQMLHTIGEHTTAQAMEADYADMRSRMIEDFQDNFTYCPFYFMPDSVAYSFQSGAKTIQTVPLMDRNMQPILNTTLRPADSSVYFVKYGLRQRPTHTMESQYGGDIRTTGQDELEPFYPSLVLMDHLLNQVPRRAPLLNRKRVRGLGIGEYSLKSPKWAYYYRSKKFQIAYNAATPAFMYYLMRFFGPSPTALLTDN
ncbi:MAG: hypothetical protein EOP52_07545 [Sphingobacteriales bacterium]|nr:MAG: hypothetical protein EOP52_07545 [Sphingobacteriales bacterium]